MARVTDDNDADDNVNENVMDNDGDGDEHANIHGTHLFSLLLTTISFITKNAALYF